MKSLTLRIGGEVERSQFADKLPAANDAWKQIKSFAFRIGADEIVTYDGELAGRAAAAGLPVLSPGS